MIELLTPKDLQKLLKCSLPYIYKLADEGRISCVRIPCPGANGKRKKDMVRFKQVDAFQFIEDHYTKKAT